MSWMQSSEPICKSSESASALETVIEGKSRDLGGFTVRRMLPSPARRLLGPFIFFDHMGPVKFEPGQGIDVRPHPHINLATVTYLFEGEILHRDSLGSHQAIRPGEINWMTAGRGIVHSERSSAELKKIGGPLHGIQLWVALPKGQEEVEPEFHHHPASSLPEIRRENATLRVLVGSAYGVQSPVRTLSSLFYVDARLPPGGKLSLTEEHPERAVYIVKGALRFGHERGSASQMLVFKPGVSVVLEAETDSQFLLLGGSPLDGERHLWWNFVSSSKERIEIAKQDWKEGRFSKVPGDETEFIPLPE